MRSVREVWDLQRQNRRNDYTVVRDEISYNELIRALLACSSQCSKDVETRLQAMHEAIAYSHEMKQKSFKLWPNSWTSIWRELLWSPEPLPGKEIMHLLDIYKAHGYGDPDQQKNASTMTPDRKAVFLLSRSDDPFLAFTYANGSLAPDRRKKLSFATHQNLVHAAARCFPASRLDRDLEVATYHFKSLVRIGGYEKVTTDDWHNWLTVLGNLMQYEEVGHQLAYLLNSGPAPTLQTLEAVSRAYKAKPSLSKDEVQQILALWGKLKADPSIQLGQGAADLLMAMISKAAHLDPRTVLSIMDELSARPTVEGYSSLMAVMGSKGSLELAEITKHMRAAEVEVDATVYNAYLKNALASKQHVRLGLALSAMEREKVAFTVETLTIAALAASQQGNITQALHLAKTGGELESWVSLSVCIHILESVVAARDVQAATMVVRHILSVEELDNFDLYQTISRAIGPLQDDGLAVLLLDDLVRSSLVRLDADRLAQLELTAGLDRVQQLVKENNWGEHVPLQEVLAKLQTRALQHALKDASIRELEQRLVHFAALPLESRLEEGTLKPLLAALLHRRDFARLRKVTEAMADDRTDAVPDELQAMTHRKLLRSIAKAKKRPGGIKKGYYDAAVVSMAARGRLVQAGEIIAALPQAKVSDRCLSAVADRYHEWCVSQVRAGLAPSSDTSQ